MNYRELNIYDKASLLKNMLSDEDLHFYIMINGEMMNLCHMAVDELHHEIALILDHERIKMETVEAFRARREKKLEKPLSFVKEKRKYTKKRKTIHGI